MKGHRGFLALVALVAAHAVFGQFTTGAGNVYLQASGAVNIGTSAASSSWLTVSGDQLGTGEVFRTIGPSSSATYWKMFRNTDELGRLYGNSSGSGFNIQ